MIVKSEHEIFRRRGGRNAALGYVLGGFVVLIMAVTMAKLADGDLMKGYDHERPAGNGVRIVQ
ncbi:MAG: cytochrome C oxidase assembly protein [Pseudomonadota bacterium]